VYLVGGGPGDPDLLTLKAARILADADVVIYDRLVSAEVLAHSNPNAVLIYAGKALGRQEAVQNEIFEWILHYGTTAKSIVRLKSGDPMIFGRGGEEAAYLSERGFDVEVVPGVSSAIAGPTLAGIPITYRGIAASFTVIAGHRQSLTETDWSKYANIDTLLILMGVEHRDIIANALIDSGRFASEPVAFIENASTDRQNIIETTLGAVARNLTAVSAPAIFVIGEVVRLRREVAAPEYAEVAR
jgi:uroporphyrin-III C-methyltransferase